jgi:predicted nucleic acid-binding Zn ribbon protein
MAAGPAAARARGRARPVGRDAAEAQLTGSQLAGSQLAGTQPGGPEVGGPEVGGPEVGSAAAAGLGAGGPGAGGAEADAAQPGGPGVAAAQPGAVRPVSPRAARRVRRDDPQALSAAIGGLLDAEGWNLAAATGSVFGRWPQIVGADLAAHTSPDSLRDGELTVLADSTAWATQLRLLQAQLIRRLNTELGAGTVLRVKVRGPVTVTRRPGEWRVRGSRGPRDTYG